MFKQAGANAKPMGFGQRREEKKALPPFVLGHCTYLSSKPVILLLPSGSILEFSTVEAATAYLESARRSGATGAAETRLFLCQADVWAEPGEEAGCRAAAS